MQRASRADLQSALHQAVESGKRRAAKNNKKILAADAATRAKVSMTLSASITSMRREGQAAIDKYRLEDKNALKAIKQGLIADLKQAKLEMARDTKRAAAGAMARIAKASRDMKKMASANKADRQRLRARIERN